MQKDVLIRTVYCERAETGRESFHNAGVRRSFGRERFDAQGSTTDRCRGGEGVDVVERLEFCGRKALGLLVREGEC
jgi:hypothetical protein